MSFTSPRGSSSGKVSCSSWYQGDLGGETTGGLQGARTLGRGIREVSINIQALDRPVSPCLPLKYTDVMCEQGGRLG